ncbi:chromosome partitioning protein [Zafaria cholistanensis]|uniref:non-specific protein-tyrosine kinase n=1 Tax=Zafaria cholistanensis TaxID=1682741 RepID=A0A5A7NSE2_9MICC|nr:polysaccharide biosynthesis tyrosine autokinase [Zafaria cholistanensis]GER22671.1 chromosome partitioning protein [Zafaria cholistanensis]
MSELMGYLKAVLNGWWKVLICAVLGAALAMGATAAATPQYESKVGFFVVAPSSQNQSALEADALVRGRIDAYTALMTSRQFMTQLVSASDEPLQEEQLVQAISASGNADQHSLTVTVRASDPHQALALARSVATSFGKLVNDLEADSDKPQTVLNVVSEPQLGQDPVSPRPLLNLLLGILAGLVVGAAIVILKRQADETVRSAQQLELEPALPLLATIPLDGAVRRPQSGSDPGTSLVLTESARRLRTSLHFGPGYSNHSVLAVTSPRRGDGKTTTALYLALALAEAGERVLLVEADLRNPTLAHRLGIPAEPGLAETLSQAAPVDAVHRNFRPRLDVLPAGTQIGNSAPLLGSPAMARLLEQARADYDVVVLDTTSLLPFADAAVAAALSDRAIMVTRYGRTPLGDIAIGLNALKAVQATVVGTTLNAVPLSRVELRAYAAGQRSELVAPGAGPQGGEASAKHVLKEDADPVGRRS